MEKSNLTSASTNPSNLASTLINTTPSTTASTFSSSCGISISATATTTTTASSVYVQSSLKVLNKASYKISKPMVLSRSSNPSPNLPKAPPLPAAAPVSAGAAAAGPGAPPQPPVYNIDKNDFRDVVQKLTGSPAHHHSRPAAPSPAPPIATPVATSRLHRIRPPPLAHLAPRPSPLVPAVPQPVAAVAAMDPWTRPPLSPLPPLPTVSAAAESPISAYMRRLHAGGGGQPALGTAAAAQPSVLGSLSSPLGFGCLPSPRSAYQMMMAPGLSPTSPGVQLPSPRLGDP